MKQKKIGDILYIYSDDPYVITEDLDATTIYVQEERYEEYLALNGNVSDKIYKKNYKILTSLTHDWQIYMGKEDDDGDDPIPEKKDPNISWSNSAYEAVIGKATDDKPVLYNPYSLPVEYFSSNVEVAVIDGKGNLTLKQAGTSFIHATVKEDSEWNSATVSYTLSVSNPSTVEPEIPEGNAMAYFFHYPTTNEIEEAVTLGAAKPEGKTEIDFTELVSKPTDIWFAVPKEWFSYGHYENFKWLDQNGFNLGHYLEEGYSGGEVNVNGHNYLIFYGMIGKGKVYIEIQ